MGRRADPQLDFGSGGVIERKGRPCDGRPKANSRLQPASYPTFARKSQIRRRQLLPLPEAHQGPVLLGDIAAAILARRARGRS
jgi:hypothetical protein